MKSLWWIHLPPLLVIAAMTFVMAAQRPWPLRAPVHFDFHWRADRWGSPWQFAVFPVLATSNLICCFVESILWTRHQEARKKFNLVLPLLTAPLGAIAGIHFWYWLQLKPLAEGKPTSGAWPYLITTATTLTVAAAILESLRTKKQ